MKSHYEDSISNAVREYRAMDLSHSDVDFMLKTHGLELYHEFFKQHNPSHYLPYHNEYHSYCVVLNCYEGAVHERLGVDSFRSLLVAALFHDYDHTGGDCGGNGDSFNIYRAVRGLSSAHSYTRSRLEELSSSPDAILSTREYDRAVQILKSTKYPYDGSPATIEQSIIRDADLMQLYEASDRKLAKQFRGLREEMEKSGKTYTIEQWADGCSEFNGRVEWNTEWATKKSDARCHRDKVERLHRLLMERK